MHRARGWVDVAGPVSIGRRWSVLAALLACVLAGTACNGTPQPGPPAGNGGQQESDIEQGEQAQPGPDSPDGFTIEVPFEALGRHLEATEIEVGLQFWLEASEDALIAALPGRAKASVGVLYQPSLDSPTGETFWIHVYSDQTRDDAIEWVRHLASQPPSLGRIIVPQTHELFDAAFREAPIVGDASVLIELHHGHSGGCWRSALLVFAQNGVIVFMKSAIEVTRIEATAGGAEMCDDSGAIAPLTDINRVALAISEQLPASS